jgi:hypothetical protein
MALIEPQAGLPGFVVKAVTFEALIGQDRSDIAREVNVLGRAGRALSHCKKQKGGQR